MCDAFDLNNGKVRVASCNHQKSKLHMVEGEDGFWVAELRVQQVKIGASHALLGEFNRLQFLLTLSTVFMSK